MSPIRLSLLCLLLASPCATGAELNLRADWWDYDVSGSVDRRGDVQDLDADLGVEARGHNMAYALAWNTGPGWVPDFAASYTRIDAGGERVTPGFRFGPIVLAPGSVARGDADLEDIDLTLRYPFALGNSRLWAGVTLKRVHGDVVIGDDASSAEDRQRIDQAFPLLHLAASVPLSSWLALSAQGNAVKYGDNEAWEGRAGVSLGLLESFGINLGWQTKHYRVADGDYLLDATLSGAVAGAFITFR
jgi:hypothetical protein